jgi:hypothetical protein
MALVLHFLIPSLSASLFTPSIQLRFGFPTLLLPSGVPRMIFLQIRHNHTTKTRNTRYNADSIRTAIHPSLPQNCQQRKLAISTNNRPHATTNPKPYTSRDEPSLTSLKLTVI